MRTLTGAVVLCLALAGMASGQWERCEPLPVRILFPGRGFVYGNDHIWAMYPDTIIWGNDTIWETSIFAYDIDDSSWEDLWFEEMRLEHYALAYVPRSLPDDHWLFFIGDQGTNNDPEPTYFIFDIDEEELVDEGRTDFALGPGAALAYQPGPVYTYPLHGGRVYCFPGNGNEFWRYALPPRMTDQAVDGICPPEGAIITHQTPPFHWPPPQGRSTPEAEHRLVVCRANPFLPYPDTILDVVLDTTYYATAVPLDTGEYSWVSGYREDQVPWAWSDERSFEVEEPGWAQLGNLPFDAEAGASLAYDYQNYYGYATRNLLALPGGRSTAYWHYDPATGIWDSIGETPRRQDEHGHMATPYLGTGLSRKEPWAIFAAGAQDEDLYYHDKSTNEWYEQTDRLPRRPRAGAAIIPVYHAGDDWVYYVPGRQGISGDDFWRLKVTEDQRTAGGGQAGISLPMTASARLIGRGDVMTLQYRLDASGLVRVLVCDVAGRVMATLASGEQPAGTHELRWRPKASDIPSGAYFILLDAGPQQARLKTVVK